MGRRYLKQNGRLDIFWVLFSFLCAEYMFRLCDLLFSLIRYFLWFFFHSCVLSTCTCSDLCDQLFLAHVCVAHAFIHFVCLCVCACILCTDGVIETLTFDGVRHTGLGTNSVLRYFKGISGNQRCKISVICLFLPLYSLLQRLKQTLQAQQQQQQQQLQQLQQQQRVVSSSSPRSDSDVSKTMAEEDMSPLMELDSPLSDFNISDLEPMR